MLSYLPDHDCVVYFLVDDVDLPRFEHPKILLNRRKKREQIRWSNQGCMSIQIKVSIYDLYLFTFLGTFLLSAAQNVKT